MSNEKKYKPDPNLKLMDQIKQALRYHHYSYQTEKIYSSWITRFLKYHEFKLHGLHAKDIKEGLGSVWLPDALERKYPNCGKEIQWQYLFPANKISVDPRSGIKRRHHLMESSLQKAVKIASKRASIDKRVSCHTFRHCFATHLL